MKNESKVKLVIIMVESDGIMVVDFCKGVLIYKPRILFVVIHEYLKKTPVHHNIQDGVAIYEKNREKKLESVIIIA